MTYVTISYGVDAQPEYISCLATDYGAKPVVAFAPGILVAQGSFVIGADQQMPPTELYTQWFPPRDGFWVALAPVTLPSSQPSYGASMDGLHFSVGPSLPPSG